LAAYLGDGRLLDHLANRLTENGLLDYYGNPASAVVLSLAGGGAVWLW
jgi:hypothetical protein